MVFVVTFFVMIVTSSIGSSFDQISNELGMLNVTAVLIINRKVVFLISLLWIAVEIMRFCHHRLAQVLLV